MGMNSTEPDPHNPSDVTSLRVESLARVGGATRGERWFRSLVQNSSDIMMILETDGTVRYVSPAIERVLGFRAEDFVGTRAFDYVHPEDIEHMSKSFAETLEKPGVHPPIIEYRVRAADGSWRHMEAIRSNWLGDPHIAGVVANVRDITDRKEAEERFRSLVQNSSDVITVADVDGTILYDSPAVEKVLGYKPEERVGTNAFDYIGPREAERVTGMIEEILSSPGARLTGEMWWPHKDGSFRYLEVTPTNLLEDPAVRGIVITWRDITERKRVQEALREAEAKYRTLVEQLPAITYVNTLARSNDKLYVSPQIESILGVSVAEWTSDPQFWVTLLHPEDRERVLAEVARSYETGEPLATEYRMIARGGRLVWFRDEAMPVRDDAGRFYYHHGVMLDVTERREAEEERVRQARQAALRADVSAALTEGGTLPTILQRCTERMVHHLDAAFARIWTLDEEEDVLELQASAGMYTHLDGPHSRVPVGEYKIGLIAKERLPHLTNAVTNDPLVSDKEWAEREGMVAFAGHPLVVEDRLVGVMAMFAREPLEEDTIEALASVADLTAQGIERKRTEEALQRSESSLATAQRIAHLGNWEYDITKDEARWSDEMYRIFGFAPRQFVPRYRTFLNSVHPEDRDLIRGSVRKALYEEEQGSVDYRVVRPDGEVRVVQSLYEVVRDVFGRAVKLTGTVHDITEFKEAEERRREAEERYRVLVETVPAVTYTDRAVGSYTNSALYTSPQIEALVGYSVEEWLDPERDLWEESLHPEDRAWVLATDERSKATGEPFAEEYRLIAKDGSAVWVSDEAALMRNEAGEPLYWQGVLVDVTERKKAEETLTEERNLLRTLIESVPDYIFVKDTRSRFVLNNTQHLRAFGMEKQEEAVGKTDFDVFPEEMAQRYYADEQEVIRSGRPLINREEPMRDATGEERWNSTTKVPLRDSSGKIVGLVGIARDITERKKIEKALEENRRWLETIVGNIPVVLFALDREGVFTLSEGKGLEILGLRPGEVVGRSVFEVYRDVPEILEQVRRTLGGEAISAIVGLGEYAFETFYTPLRDEVGEVVGVIGVATDVTERKAAEEALRQSEERYRLVARATNEVIWDHDLTTHGQVWDGATEAMFGYPPEEMGDTGEWWEERIHPDDRDRVLANVEAVFRDGREAWTDEYRFRRADGAYATVVDRAYVVRDAEGRPVRMLGSIMDVTERRRAERTLREAEARYRTLVEQIPVATYIQEIEHNNAIIYMSPQIEEILGYSSREYTEDPRLWLNVLHPEDRERVLAEDRRTDETGEPFRVEYRMLRRDGGVVWVQDEALLVRDAAGRPLSWQGVMLDITERMRAEEEIREANRRLGELATLRADFTAMVAHELDTPLAVIRGYADVLATGELGPAESGRALAQIQSETEVLNALVEDVRVAASAERKDFAVNPRRVPVGELLEDAARFAATLPGDHPLILKGKDDAMRWDGVLAGHADPFIFGGADGREVWADRYRIDQVLRNLLANAVKYSPEGAPIELRVVPGETSGRVRIEVIDRGPGIHPDDVERIFEKFGRGRDPEGRKVAGLGLGLYLSRRILRAHGSDLTFDSTPEGGSVFGFELEAADA